jgi:signal transduction histidine kinase
VPRPRLNREWLAGHKQRLAYVLVAVSMAAVVGSGIAGGLLLHHAADLERQTQRTQGLGSVAFQLQDSLLRAHTENAVGERLAADRARALAAAEAAFQLIRAHDRNESDRLQASYAGYLRASSRAFAQAAANRGLVPAPLQRRVETQLTGLESRVDAEIEGLARATRVTNPEARLALIVTALAAALLVGALVWQFEIERRAGRLDRDNAERSAELMRLRNDFVANVSHELRTPLTSILGYLELIDQNESGDETADNEPFLAVIQRNADRLLRLVSDLLLVAEVEDSTLALDIHTIDLGEIATHCVEAAKPAADAKQIQLTLSDGSPGSLEGDPVRLAQMMDNLVSNAIKFTPAGGRVTVRTTDQDGLVLFAVTDSGIGVSAVDQAQLFDPFFRTRAAAAQAVQGTGLGLTITKAIVDAHGGSISVESALGSGATFQVQLPRTQALAGRRLPASATVVTSS